MGNCCSFGCVQKYQPYASSSGGKRDDKVVATWKSTGIIGLRDRALKELPANVEHVGEAAKVLDATNNKIVALPIMLTQLTQLTRLVLASNLLVELPGPILLALSPNLKILVLDGNRIEQLPDEVGALLRLEKLSLKGNCMAALNPCVGKCVALQFLNIAQVSRMTRIEPFSLAPPTVLVQHGACNIWGGEERFHNVLDLRTAPCVVAAAPQLRKPPSPLSPSTEPAGGTPLGASRL